jgi:hypothetical protein
VVVILLPWAGGSLHIIQFFRQAFFQYNNFSARLDAGGTAGEEGAAVRYVRSGRTGACRCPGAPLICTRCAGASRVRAAWVQHRLSWDAEVGVLVWVLMARAGPAQRLNAPGRSVCQQVGGQHVSLQTRL